jgi:predicted Rossmann fold nucleotide-binding protein DprA/Smf involved in DNA uptake
MKIVIVGSRRMSEYGRKVIEMLLPKIEKEGMEIGTGRVQGCNAYVIKTAKDKVKVFEPKYGFEKMNEELAEWGEILLVIEGGKESGTILLAEKFLEKGKEVWAVPGRIDEPNSEAANFLIKNGARVVTGVEDIGDS